MNASIHDTDSLLQALAAGRRAAFLYFWGHTGAPGVTGKNCLSQWHPSPFTVDGTCYATAEHYMMVQKALLFDDAATARQMLATTDPKEAKRLGRQVRDFDGAAWSAVCERIVFDGNLAKFAQNENMRRFLLSTGDDVLVEASPVDAVWGIGLAEQEAKNLSPREWQGRNLLGYALMKVRAALRDNP